MIAIVIHLAREGCISALVNFQMARHKTKILITIYINESRGTGANKGQGGGFRKGMFRGLISAYKCIPIFKVFFPL